LTKSTSSSQPIQASLAIFNIRSFALSCLLHTSPDVVDPNTFWAQATKFGTSFVDTATPNVTNDNSARTLLSTFAGFVDTSERAPNRDVFMAGRGFTVFCQLWMKCARQVWLLEWLMTSNDPVFFKQRWRMSVSSNGFQVSQVRLPRRFRLCPRLSGRVIKRKDQIHPVPLKLRRTNCVLHLTGQLACLSNTSQSRR
jgi:hypothetical protein